MESNWKLREFPVSKEDLESMKKSMERLNMCSDTYAVMPASTALIHRKLHHCTVCDVILNSCTQTRDHCNGRKHLARLKLSGKDVSFGPKGENIHTTSPVNSSGIVSLKSNEMSLKDMNSQNMDSSEFSPTCRLNQSTYAMRTQTATSTPKTTPMAMVESNSNQDNDTDLMGKENGRKTVLQELAETFADSLNDAIVNNEMGSPPSRKSPKKVVARCSICNLEFSGQVVLQSHLTGSKHAKKVKSLEILRELDTKSHCIIKGDTSKFLKCEECDAVVNSSQHMQMHYRGVNMNGAGDGPGIGPLPQVLGSNGRARDGQIKQYGFKEGFKYMCRLCKVYLNSEIQLQQHMNSKKHKESTMRGQRCTPRSHQYEKENDGRFSVTPFYQKKTPKQQGISYWLAQQQKIHRLNMANNPPLRYMIRGNSTSLVSQRTFPSTLQDYYTNHRYVI
ncbi:zinc finger protein 385B-like isoform X2 [Ischnura elegans]|uniref:zinc finger protein 385B-like isoform X2 n=1 Tax=Ischnura elegans TaxID=197161 RepID=UPI001ED8A8D1|nr:zinc finger protein 385B-like isoform X2 [Ischnura elegans]